MRFTLILTVTKLVQMYIERTYVTDKDVLFCSWDGKRFIFEDRVGNVYLASLQINVLLACDLARCVFYEGALRAFLFGVSTPTNTYCMRTIYCCMYTPTEIPEFDLENTVEDGTKSVDQSQV